MSNLILNGIEINGEMEVFILEDSAVYQKRLITCLRTIGFKGKVTIAGTLTDAKKLIHESKPGLILSDWNLPDGIGIDFLKLIRTEKKFDNVPILMVTTEGETAKIMEAVKHGADDYIVKPFYENNVIEKLAFAFEKRTQKKDSLHHFFNPKTT